MKGRRLRITRTGQGGAHSGSRSPAMPCVLSPQPCSDNSVLNCLNPSHYPQMPIICPEQMVIVCPGLGGAIAMHRIILAILLTPLLAACGFNDPPPPLLFEPVDGSRFKSPSDRQQQHSLADNRCRANALQVASGVAATQIQTTNVYTAPARGSAGRIGSGPSEGLARGLQIGAARRAQSQAIQQRNELARATFSACMNEHGFVQAPM
jgi:hypothetical protein